MNEEVKKNENTETKPRKFDRKKPRYNQSRTRSDLEDKVIEIRSC